MAQKLSCGSRPRERLCEYSDRYRSRKDVQPLLDAKLAPINEKRARPEGTLTVAVYGQDYFLPFVERELKPSTYFGYKSLWRMYLKPRLADIAMRDFRCVDATNLLATIHREHKIGRATLRHCKALLSVIFVHAKRGGILDSNNPIQDCGLPNAAAASKPTHASSAEEVLAMLDALQGVARTAVALIFFCALLAGRNPCRALGRLRRKSFAHSRQHVANAHDTAEDSGERCSCSGRRDAR